MSWKFEHEESETKGRFALIKDGKELGEITYVYAGAEKIIIDHTLVDPSLKGQGAGKALVDQGTEFARKNGLKILPLCPFAKKVMTRDAEKYKDVLSGV